MGRKKVDYQVLDHTADLGLEVRARDLKALFRAAALAMMDVMVRAPIEKPTESKRISVSALDLPDLLVRWLGEVLYLFQGDGYMVTEVRIDAVVPTHLDATVDLVPFNPERHEILCEIKAVTYHLISVAEGPGLCSARVIFDL
jgi:SHS2 domain-containing protein